MNDQNQPSKRQDQPEPVRAQPILNGQERLLQEGNNLMRLENTTQMMVAVQRKRNEEEIRKACLAELDLYPTLAEKVIYRKPVGRMARCPRCGADTNYRKQCPKCEAEIPEVYAENLNIRAAESLTNRWGNNASGCDVTEDNDDYVILTAAYLDYESNMRRMRQQLVPKSYTTREKRVLRYTPDRFATMLNGVASRMLREVMLRSLPAGLKADYEQKARDLMEQTPLAERQVKMLAQFSRLGVTARQIEGLKGKLLTEFSQEDYTDLIGVYNAITTGEDRVADIFGADGESQAEDKSGLHVTGGTPTVENPPRERQNTPEPKAEAPAPAPEPPGEEATTEAPPSDAYTCKACKATFNDPPVYHKGRHKNRQHCPECGSIQIGQTEAVPAPGPKDKSETPPPEPDPSIVEPEEADPTPAPSGNAGTATTSAAAAGTSTPAGTPSGPEPLMYCTQDHYTFPLSDAKPSKDTQFGVCPLCESPNIQPVDDSDQLQCRRGHNFMASKRTKSGKCPACLSSDVQNLSR